MFDKNIDLDLDNGTSEEENPNLPNPWKHAHNEWLQFLKHLVKRTFKKRFMKRSIKDTKNQTDYLLITNNTAFYSQNKKKMSIMGIITFVEWWKIETRYNLMNEWVVNLLGIVSISLNSFPFFFVPQS